MPILLTCVLHENSSIWRQVLYCRGCHAYHAEHTQLLLMLSSGARFQTLYQLLACLGINMLIWLLDELRVQSAMGL